MPPQVGQKTIPLKDWKRFLRVADWFDRTHGHRPPSVLPPKPVTTSHWGKLDANLLYSDTTGVTVSIWSGNPLVDTGRDIEEVLPPPWLTSGQFDSGDWVIVRRVDGLWYANAGEVETVVTDFQVDTTNNLLQVKTRSIVVVPAGDESGWTTVHTGTEC